MGISIPLVILMNNNYIYSGTLDSRPSKIGTQYVTVYMKTHNLAQFMKTVLLV